MSAHHSTFKFSWLAWTFLGFFLFALLAFIAVKNVTGYNDYDTRRAQKRYDNLAKLQADEQKNLTSLTWVDKDKKIISLPLEEAVPEEIATLQAKPLAPGSVIPGSMPPPTPPATPSPAPGTPAPSTPAPAAQTTTNAAPVAPKM